MIVVFDLDKVCADSAWRDAFIVSDGWDAFHERLVFDDPVKSVLAIVNGMADQGFEVIACTGRPEKYRQSTLKWLATHGFRFSRLLMRKEGDFRKSPAVKLDLMEETYGPQWRHKVSAIFDDREDILAEFSALGITVYQVVIGRGSPRVIKGISQ